MSAILSIRCASRSCLALAQCRVCSEYIFSMDRARRCANMRTHIWLPVLHIPVVSVQCSSVCRVSMQSGKMNVELS